MRICARCFCIVALCFCSAVWAAGDYTLEYAMLDLSGGAVADVAAPNEDILTGDLQGLSIATSRSYDIVSLLSWPAPPSAAVNWTLYE